MKKRVLSVLLAIVMVVGLFPVTAGALPAAHHTHPVCGATHSDIGDHAGECANITWTEWNGTDKDDKTEGIQLTEGSYYLGENITVSSFVEISGEVNLCLNGHSITSSGESTITVSEGAVLNICDCSTGETGGKIANTSYSNGRGINNSGTVNIYGGTIEATGDRGYGINNSGIVNVYGGSVGGKLYSIDNEGSGKVNISGGSVNKDIENSGDNGTVNVSGGSVKGSTYGIQNGKGTVSITGGSVSGEEAIYNPNGGRVTVSAGSVIGECTGIHNGNSSTLSVSGGSVSGKEGGISNYNATATISGAPTITGTTADVYLNSAIITIGDGGLTYTSDKAISVKMSTPGAFTTGWTTKMGENADYDSYFTSANDGYIVQPDGSGELKLAAPITYTVTYNGNGATSGDVPADSNSPYISGSTVAVLDNTGDLAKPGYVFAGWNTGSNGYGTDYAPRDTFNISGNTTLYAQWEERDITSQPTKNDPTVLTNGDSDIVSYQWYKGTMSDVTTENASTYTYDEKTSSYSDGWWTCHEAGGYSTPGYFTIVLNAGDSILAQTSATINEGQLGIVGAAQDWDWTTPDDHFLVTAPADGNYDLRVSDVTYGGGTQPTVKAQVFHIGSTPADGATSKTLVANEDGWYACKITYKDGTVLCSGPVEYEAPVHNHSWTYAAEDTDADGKPETIVATCGGSGTCEATNKKLTIVAPLHEQVNDGKAPEATFANNATSVGGVDSLPDIMYQQTATSYPCAPIGDPTATPPTGAGRFEASITVEGQTASVVYSIEKLDREDIKQFTVSDITNNSFVITLHEDDWGKTDFVCEVGGDYIDFKPDDNGKATITVPEDYAGSGNLCVCVYQEETDTHKNSNTKDATVSLLPATPTPAETPVIGTDLSTAEVTYDKDAPATALSITASVTDGGTLSYQWYKNGAASTDGAQAIGSETGASYTPATSAAGTTYYYCVITNTKDGQTATTISAIAKITVNDPAPTTYTVTYDANGGNGTMNAATGIYGDYTLPTCTFTAPAGKQFKAWSVGSEEKAAGAVIAVSADITVTALWEDISYSITGSVTDTSAGTAAVKLMQGNTEVKTATVTLTSSDTNYTGTYTFIGVAPGVYNIVVTKGDVTMTVLVTVASSDVAVGTISMSDGKKNSVLDNTDAGSYAATVGGLDAIANSVTLGPGDSVEIKLTVTAEAVDNTDPEHSAIKTVAPGKTLEFIDLSLTKRINSGEETDYGSENTQLLTIVIPFVQGNKQNVTVYRYHGTQATAMTKDPTAGSEGFKLGNGFITIYAKNFSTYAIGYTVPAVNPPSGGGGDYTPTYAITVERSENGEVKANRSYASSGATVTITVTPEDGYALYKLTVTDSQGNKIELTDKGDGTFTFKMPGGKVTIEASFVDDGSFSVCPGDHTCPIWPYTDAETTAWYHDGVHYCIENGLMTGYGNGIFKPNADTTRAMITVMLWRLNGSPVVNDLLDFEDVEEGQWYTEAIRWAKSEGIAAGYGNGYFGTNDAITREQMVTILWRYAQYKGIDVSVGEDTNILSYNDAFDMAEYAIPAMQWACGSGMVQGMNDPNGEGMILAPESKGTRAQIATMMMRFCTEIVK